MKKSALATVLLAVLIGLFTMGCPEGDTLSPDASIDAPALPQKCSLTPIAKLPAGNDGLGFVGITRLADGTVLVATTVNVYKVNLETKALTKVAGNPDTNHLIVGISSAPNQPILVASGRGLYQLNGSTYSLVTAAPGAAYFTAVAQEENKDPLITTSYDVYSVNLASKQLMPLASRPETYFFSRLSRAPGLDPLVATGHTIYRYSNSALIKILIPAEWHYEHVAALGQTNADGFVFATGYAVYFSNSAGDELQKIAQRHSLDHTYFSDISVGSVDDVLITSGLYLYRLEIGCAAAAN